MTPAWWLLLIAGVLVAAGAVIWLGAQNDSDGAPLIENPGGVIVALFGGVTAILAIVLPQVLAIKHEVKNSHDTNMRDDLDDKHDAIIARIDKVFGAVSSDIRGLRRDVGRNTDRLDYVSRRLDNTTDRVDRLEDTQAPGKESP